MYEILLDCISLISMGIFLSAWAVILTFGAGLIYGIVKSFSAVLRTHFQIKKLPLRRYGLRLVVIDNPAICTAFTFGIFRPEIYISKGLFNTLSKDELRSVFLHELHHRTQCDPLKMLLLSIIKDTFFYLPIFRDVSEYFYSLREKAADDSAICATAKPLELASALLKVSSYGRNIIPMSVSISGGGLVEERVKRLLGESSKAVIYPRLKKMLASILLLMFILSAPTAYSLGMGKTCNQYKCNETHHHSVEKDLCSTGLEKEDCGNHCEMKM